MDSLFGDPSLSSTQLRQKAYNIIRQSDRPMASSEIEKWIRNHDYDLWCKVSAKCKDYVRVILSQTRGKTIMKYRALKPISGIDKRATFYGLYGRKYPTDMWIPTNEVLRSKNRKYDEEAYVDEKPYSPSKEESGYYSDEIVEPIPKMYFLPQYHLPPPVEIKRKIELPHLPPIMMLSAPNPVVPAFVSAPRMIYQPELNPIELLLN